MIFPGISLQAQWKPGQTPASISVKPECSTVRPDPGDIKAAQSPAPCICARERPSVAGIGVPGADSLDMDRLGRMASRDSPNLCSSPTRLALFQFRRAPNRYKRHDEMCGGHGRKRRDTPALSERIRERSLFDAGGPLACRAC